MSGFIFQCFYDIVCHIPAGTVATYGQVARCGDAPLRPDRRLRHGRQP